MSPLSQSHPWIEPRIKHIGEYIDQDKHHRDKEHCAHNYRKIILFEGIHDHLKFLPE